MNMVPICLFSGPTNKSDRILKKSVSFAKVKVEAKVKQITTPLSLTLDLSLLGTAFSFHQL